MARDKNLPFAKCSEYCSGNAGGGGADGLSAYEIALEHGFEGTEEEWLASLHGEDGYTPQKGVDYYTEAEKKEFIQEIESEVVGDVETALDTIIELQNSLIGGGSV